MGNLSENDQEINPGQTTEQEKNPPPVGGVTVGASAPNDPPKRGRGRPPKVPPSPKEVNPSPAPTLQTSLTPDQADDFVSETVEVASPDVFTSTRETPAPLLLEGSPVDPYIIEDDTEDDSGWWSWLKERCEWKTPKKQGVSKVSLADRFCADLPWEEAQGWSQHKQDVRGIADWLLGRLGLPLLSDDEADRLARLYAAPRWNVESWIWGEEGGFFPAVLQAVWRTLVLLRTRIRFGGGGEV